MSEKLNIGGQAVLEGVMMRSPHAFTVAVRKGGKPGAEIAVLKESIKPIGERIPLFKKAVIRGSAALFEALWLGIRALNFSANEALEEGKDGKKEELGPWTMVGTLVVALAFSLGLFLALPLLITNLLGMRYDAVNNSILFNLTDGVLRGRPAAHGRERTAVLTNPSPVRHKLSPSRDSAVNSAVLAHSGLLAPLGKGNGKGRSAPGDRWSGI